MLGEEPTQLAVDAPADTEPPGPLVLTDGLLDRERFFGRVHDGYASVRTPGDRSHSGNPVPDYQLDRGDRWLTTARLVGAESISASSSTADSNNAGGARPGELPYAAVDGDAETCLGRRTPAAGDRPGGGSISTRRST